MKDWLDLPLKTLGENPRMVAERHDKLTAESGPAASNGCMRTLRAVYNHARRSARELPPDNPTMAVDWNQEKRRDTALGAMDLPKWFEQAAHNPPFLKAEENRPLLRSRPRPPGAVLSLKRPAAGCRTGGEARQGRARDARVAPRRRSRP